jgi:hypothetical protein
MQVYARPHECEQACESESERLHAPPSDLLHMGHHPAAAAATATAAATAGGAGAGGAAAMRLRAVLTGLTR